MSKRHLFAVFVCALLLALPAATQMEEDTIARIVLFRAKPGMGQQLEDGLKKHMAFHKAQNGTWAWRVWSYVSGEQTGMYGAGTFDHSWSDFDSPDIPDAVDGADATQNILPFVAEGAEWRYYQMLPKVSKPRAADTPPALIELYTFRIHQGKDAEFNAVVKKFHEAIAKTQWPVNYAWYGLANGGDGPEYVLAIPHDNWASVKGPEKNFGQMLEEAVGRQEAESLFERWGKAVKSESSTLARTRPDLSYIPAGSM